MLPLLLAALALSCAADSGARDWPTAPPFERPDEPIGPLPSSVSVAPIGPGTWRVRIHLPSTIEAKSVHLAGSFNGWDAGGLPMERGADGRWVAELEARSGRLSYKFVVDGRSWIPDPSNFEREPDGHGGENTVLTLGAAGASADALTEGRRRLAWGHEPDLPVYLQRAGGRRGADPLPRAAGARAAAVRRGCRRPPPDGHELLDGFTFYECRVPLTEEPRRYTFLVETEEGVRRDPAIQTLSEAALPEFRTPDWAKHATWYQLMPDRFRNGDPENDRPGTRPWTSDWYEASPDESGVSGDGRALGLGTGSSTSACTGRPRRRPRAGPHRGAGRDRDLLQPGLRGRVPQARGDRLSPRGLQPRRGRGLVRRGRGRGPARSVTWTWSPSDRVFLALVEGVTPGD